MMDGVGLVVVGFGIGGGLAWIVLTMIYAGSAGEQASGSAMARLRRIALNNELILNAAGEGIFGLDREQRITFFNAAASRLTGLGEAQVVGQPVAVVVGAVATLLSRPLPAGAAAQAATVEADLPQANGPSLPVELSVSPILEKQALTGWVVICRDLRERRQAEESQRLATAVLEWSAQPILVTDLAHVIVMVNPALSWLSGYAPEALIGQPAALLGARDGEHPLPADLGETLQREGVWRGEVWNRRPDGSLYAVWLNITRIGDARHQGGHYVAFFFDITERKRQEQHLLLAAHYDPLTGLPNRRLFQEHLASALARSPGRLALMLIDLDGFKAVNDTAGHDAGDAVLVAVASRMRSVVRAGDLVARLGGDEFVVVLEPADPAAARRAAQSIIQEVSRPIPFRGQACQVSASIGIALAPAAMREASELLEAADAAMYGVKRAGKHGYRFHGGGAPEEANATLNGAFGEGLGDEGALGEGALGEGAFGGASPTPEISQSQGRETVRAGEASPQEASS